MAEKGTRGSNDYSVIVEHGLCENTLRGEKAQESGQRSLQSKGDGWIVYYVSPCTTDIYGCMKVVCSNHAEA